MNILQKLFNKEKQFNRWDIFASGGSIPADYSNIDLLNDYNSIGWLHAVVFRIALGRSEVKWTLSDVSNPEKPKLMLEDPVLDLLHHVNPFMTSPEFIALHTIYQELCGESFWILNYNKGNEPAEIVLPNPQKMWIKPAKAFGFVDSYIYGEYPEDEKAIPLEVNKVIHFKYPSPLNIYRGSSPAQSIGVNLQAERFSAQWNRNFFYNSARPDGIIEFPHSLTDEQYERLKKQWAEKYKGVNKAHQVALLEEGTYKQIMNTVKDMDFSNLSLRNRDVILGVYGMPLSVMGISENVNKANAEAGDYTFARWILKPRHEWDCAKLNEQLLPKFKGYEKKRLGFEEVVPETTEQKMNLAESGMRSSILTIDEARKLRGEDPINGKVGECIVVPANMVLIDKEGEVVYQATQANPFGGQPFLEEENNLEESENEEELEEQPKSKRFTPEQKKEIWDKLEQKTLKQEGEFKDIFKNIFNEEGKEIVKYFEANHKLPDILDNPKTANKFKPLIEKVYLSGYEDAIG